MLSQPGQQNSVLQYYVTCDFITDKSESFKQKQIFWEPKTMIALSPGG